MVVRPRRDPHVRHHSRHTRVVFIRPRRRPLRLHVLLERMVWEELDAIAASQRITTEVLIERIRAAGRRRSIEDLCRLHVIEHLRSRSPATAAGQAIWSTLQAAE